MTNNKNVNQDKNRPMKDSPQKREQRPSKDAPARKEYSDKK